MNINFEIITSIEDPLFKNALDMYEDIFKEEFREDREIFIHSLTSKPINKHYVFIVGIKNDIVVSLSTGHYEPTTNSAFIIYLMTHPEYRNQGIGEASLKKIETELHNNAQSVHNRDANMIMLESSGVDQVSTEEEKEQARIRDAFFNKNGYLIQDYLDYVQPNPNSDTGYTPINLLIKEYLPLQKDVILPSIRSCYINKYIHGNQINREFVYKLLNNIGL